MDGWIKIHYKFLEWEWFQEDGMVILFINLLLRANYQSKKWKGVVIERGQLITGRKKLSLETGLSEKKIRTCLSRLEQTGEISINSTNRFSIITISNYETYQFNEITMGQQTANKNPEKGQQKTFTNDLLLSNYDEHEEIHGQQTANKNPEKGQQKATTSEYKNKERIYKKETSTNVEEKKVELSFANTKKTIEERSKNFYQSLVPFVSIYSKEMVRAFFDYWTEPNRSKTKMKFELERTWDTKRRLNTWSNRDKNNIKNNGTEYKQHQRQQRDKEILELNRSLSESDSSIRKPY